MRKHIKTNLKTRTICFSTRLRSEKGYDIGVTENFNNKFITQDSKLGKGVHLSKLNPIETPAVEVFNINNGSFCTKRTYLIPKEYV